MTRTGELAAFADIDLKTTPGQVPQRRPWEARLDVLEEEN